MVKKKKINRTMPVKMFTMTPEHIEYIRTRAEREGLPQSIVLRLILRDELARHPLTEKEAA